MNFKKNESAQKLRGGYYTPLDLSAFLAKWVQQTNPQKLLEPSCGDGVFFEAMSRVGGFSKTDVTGFELDEEEATRAAERVSSSHFSKLTIHQADFLEWGLIQIINKNQYFDAVLGNPPFIRYQYLPKAFQDFSESIFEALQFKFTKHTNAWVPFVLASIALLRPGGRLAMVIPSEIVHVTHAQGLRTFMGKHCKKVVLIDPQEIWFDGTLQGTVLLLAEKKENIFSPSEGVAIYPVKNKEFLEKSPWNTFQSAKPINGKTVTGKWTRALVNKESIDLFDSLAEHSSVHLFNNIARVDVGIVTGANKFFLVTDDVVAKYSLGQWAYPMFGRSEHCPGIVYDQKQHDENKRKGNATNFIWFKPTDKLSIDAKKYIEYGESQDLTLRYKCRIRTPWYSVPSVYSTEIGMLKRSHHCPRLIYNDIRAYTTDTAYRITTNTVAAKKLVGCFINPLTMLSAELEGRHYGGGVLELIPSEIERLIIPLPNSVMVDIAKLDVDIRNKPIEDVLKRQGDVVLSPLGITGVDREKLLSAWLQLCQRRQRTTD